MAYTLSKAVARLRSGPDTTWKEVDISTTALSDLFTTYYRVWVYLQNPLYGTKTLYLNVEDLKPLLGLKTYSQSLPDWLTGIGNMALPTTFVVPNLTLKPALYQDAWDAGYSVDIIDSTRSLDEPLPELDKHDLYLTRPDTNYNQFERHALVTVNGYFHRSGTIEDGIAVLKGADTWRKGNDNQIGIYSFNNVGQLTVLPITSDMILEPTAGQTLSQYAYVALGPVTQGKSVCFVIGGYLHAMDGTYTHVGNGVYRIDICKLPLLKRIFESGKYLDLSSLNIETSTTDPNQIVLSSVYTDDALLAYLTLSQSFAVVVDTPAMYMRRHQLESTELPGRFYGYGGQRFPLLINHGEAVEYMLTESDGVYLYSFTSRLTARYKINTTDYERNLSVDNTKLSDRPYQYSMGYLLEFGAIAD